MLWAVLADEKRHHVSIRSSHLHVKLVNYFLAILAFYNIYEEANGVFKIFCRFVLHEIVLEDSFPERLAGEELILDFGLVNLIEKGLKLGGVVNFVIFDQRVGFIFEFEVAVVLDLEGKSLSESHLSDDSAGVKYLESLR